MHRHPYSYTTFVPLHVHFGHLTSKQHLLFHLPSLRTVSFLFSSQQISDHHLRRQHPPWSCNPSPNRNPFFSIASGRPSPPAFWFLFFQIYTSVRFTLFSLFSLTVTTIGPPTIVTITVIIKSATIDSCRQPPSISRTPSLLSHRPPFHHPPSTTIQYQEQEPKQHHRGDPNTQPIWEERCIEIKNKNQI